MLIRRSGYPARFGNRNNSKGSQGSRSAQREGGSSLRGSTDW